MTIFWFCKIALEFFFRTVNPAGFSVTPVVAVTLFDKDFGSRFPMLQKAVKKLIVETRSVIGGTEKVEQRRQQQRNCSSVRSQEPSE